MRDSVTVNKLILIGNGFDLALGLKTDYKSFLTWYLKKVLYNSAKSNKGYYNSKIPSRSYHLFKDDLVSIFCYSDHKENRLIEIINSLDTFDKIIDFIENRDVFHLEPSSNLFKSIYKQSIDKWVDIESVYYELLKKCIENDKNNIIKLNSDFNFIKLKLEEYLSSIKCDNSGFELNKGIFSSHFFNGVDNKEVYDAKDDVFISMGSTYFLNFNYTNTLSTLIKAFNLTHRTKYAINHIHGELNSESNKIIFGFGDEMDKKYQEIEELNENKYLENIKSFQYFKTGNYRGLMRFLNAGNYQVCVYGHSCGLSDRIMLNEIFEHDNCKSIKIFFHKNENDFTNKTMEISRHFKSNNLMRKKIVNFNPNDKIPQINNKVQIKNI